MSDKLETLASIRDELRKELIFGIEARPPIALILGFSGYSHQVMPLTQKLQHATRAYVIMQMACLILFARLILQRF